VKRIVLVVTLLALGLVPSSNPPAWSGPRQEKGQAALQHEVTVALKLVQVYVTDKRGNPISDLRRDEFSLYDNKDEKQITEFERHALSLPGTAAPSSTMEPVVTAPNLPAPLLNRKFFLLFDLVFTQGKGFRIARSAALQFVESGLMPTDEASVLLFSGGRSLEVRKLPTRDHDAVRKAVESLSIADLLDRVFNEGEVVGPQILSGQEASFSNFRPSSSGGPSEIRILAGNFIWALKSFAQALRSQPGQKHVILYSKGIASATIGRGQAGGTYSELSRGYAGMCKELAAAGISVFPINTADPDALKMVFGTGETTLRETAAATGGRYLGFAVNAEKHMETVNDITGMYYVLGYPIGQTWDGKFHSVRVKVSRPGCEVHAQPGYFNPKPFAEYSKIEKEIHLVDLALSGKPLSQDPVRFIMQTFPVACTPKDNLVFIAEIPKEGFAGIDGPNVEAVSLLFNALDEIVDSRRTQIDLAVSRINQNRVFLFTALSALPGTFKCRIVLRNIETGSAAVGGVSGFVPEGGADKLLVFPPLLLSAAGGMVLSGGVGDKQNGRSAGEDLAAQAFLFDSKRYSPYLGDQLPGGAVLAAAVRCAAPIDDLSGLELSAKLISQASGKELTVPLSVIEKRDGKNTRLFLARLEIPEVDPGVFKLMFVVNDSRKGLFSQVTRSFIVKPPPASLE
jgi:VWFA-related protein